MRPKRVIIKYLQIAILLVYAWACTSCSNGAHARNIPSALSLKLVTSFSIPGASEPPSAYLDQAGDALYLVDRGSGRLTYADLKTHRSTGWQEIASAGCATPGSFDHTTGVHEDSGRVGSTTLRENGIS